MTSQPRLPTVQVLRALAALMVVVGHSIIELPTMRGNPGYLSYFHHAFGVSVFFVISGFIMAYTTENSFFGLAQGRQDFIVSRLTRIVPIYWMLTTGVLAMRFFAPSIFNSPPTTIPTLLNSYLFIPFRNADGVAFPVLAPGWSLNYEMFFYVLFVLAMFFSRIFGLRLLVGVMVSIYAFGLVFKPQNELLSVWSDPSLLRFALGIGIAYYRVPLARMPLWGALASIAIGVALYLPTNFAALHLGDNISLVIETIAPTLIVLGAVALDLRGKSFAPLLLVLIGDASYSLYLSHMFVVRLVRVAWNATHLNVEPAMFCGIVLAIAVPFAMLLASYVELPLHRRLRAMFVKRKRITAPAQIETPHALRQIHE